MNRMLKLKRSLLSTKDLIHYLKIARGGVSAFLSVLHRIGLKKKTPTDLLVTRSILVIKFFFVNEILKKGVIIVTTI